MNPAFQEGMLGIGVAIVLAAPGRREAEAGQPAAGQTGVTLDGILQRLHERDAVTFPSESRLDYRIVNAVERVLHKRATKRTMPTLEEIACPSNIRRLTWQLANFPTIVALSDSAVQGVRLAGYEPRFHFYHPSLSCLNRLYPGLDGPRAWRVKERQRRFADALLASERE